MRHKVRLSTLSQQLQHLQFLGRTIYDYQESPPRGRLNLFFMVIWVIETELCRQICIGTLTVSLKRKHDLPLFASVLLKDNNESHIKICNLCKWQYMSLKGGRMYAFVLVIILTTSLSLTLQNSFIISFQTHDFWRHMRNRLLPSCIIDLRSWFQLGWGQGAS